MCIIRTVDWLLASSLPSLMQVENSFSWCFVLVECCSRFLPQKIFRFSSKISFLYLIHTYIRTRTHARTHVALLWNKSFAGKTHSFTLVYLFKCTADLCIDPYVSWVFVVSSAFENHPQKKGKRTKYFTLNHTGNSQAAMLHNNWKSNFLMLNSGTQVSNVKTRTQIQRIAWKSAQMKNILCNRQINYFIKWHNL